MFIDEPEGNSLADLNQHLGAASAMGTGISIRLKDGTEIDTYLNHYQSSLPIFLETFTSKKNGIDKIIKKIKTSDIVWFKLRRHGRTEGYIDKDGIPTANPLIVLIAKEIKGNGKIINPGTTAIYGEKINFTGEITSGDIDEE